MTEIGIAIVDALLADASSRTNARGNTVRNIFHPANRYLFDFNLDRSIWTQFDTDSDAVYFGIWVDRKARRFLTYAEGDVILTECEDGQRYDLELAALCAFHPPGPAFSTLSDGVLTRFYQDRREWFVDPAKCPDRPLDGAESADTEV